jgi:hypothetical protein
MPAPRRSRVHHILLLAPVVFVAHFLEEAPGFVDWFNVHVERGITSELFWAVNLTGLAITVGVIAGEWSARSELSAIAVVAWLSFLMLANALFHVIAAIVDRAYVPGLVTAVVLYVPLYIWVLLNLLRAKRLTAGLALGGAILGALPMAIHGYLIVFRGSRLF